MKKIAFTLAEVLITLTIIGVIAAITIPNLMQSWRKHERITQIKEAYAIVQNAVKMAIAEHGPVSDWTVPQRNRATGTNSCTLANYFFPYLKNQKVYGSNRDKAKGCFDNGHWYYLNGVDANPGSTCYAKLQNGMDIAVQWSSYIDNDVYAADAIVKEHKIYVDVNGRKGPTMLGNDVFVFGIQPSTGIVRPSRPYWSGLSNTTNINSILNAGQQSGCDINLAIGSGLGCARVLELNHWEFPDNYPIKKF